MQIPFPQHHSSFPLPLTFYPSVTFKETQVSRIGILQWLAIDAQLLKTQWYFHTLFILFSLNYPLQDCPPSLSRNWILSSTNTTPTHLQMPPRAPLLISAPWTYLSFFMILSTATSSLLKPNQLSTLIFLSFTGSYFLYPLLEEQNLFYGSFSYESYKRNETLCS